MFIVHGIWEYRIYQFFKIIAGAELEIIETFSFFTDDMAKIYITKLT